MAARTKRQKQRIDATGLSGGELIDLRDRVENRFARVNRLSAIDTQGQTPLLAQRQKMEQAATPVRDIPSYSARAKDPATDDVRAYRKDKYGIDDIRTATAEQIAAAEKDPQAFRRGRLSNLADSGDTQQLAAAQAAAQGRSSGGKPAGFTGYPGGRRPPGGNLADDVRHLSADSGLRIAAPRHLLPRKKRPRVGPVMGGSG